MSWNKRNNRNNMHGATINILIFVLQPFTDIVHAVAYNL